MMRYLTLGRSGLKVSELCLGAMTFGGKTGWGAPEPECRKVFDAFLAAGGNFIDTANIYHGGESEQILGDFIRGRRDSLVIASKYSFSMDPANPNAGGNHRRNLVQSLEASLTRLGTEYLDLYWVHGWDRSTALPELMRALDDQVRAGRILHVGISNAPAWVIAAANALARERGWTPFTAMQLHYNLVERSIERDFFDLAAADGMAITPWSPLAGGLLSGKYSGAASGTGRLSQGPLGARVMNERNLAVTRALLEFAQRSGATPASVALAWMCQRRDATVIPIIGARTLAQLQENLACLALRLSVEQLRELDALSTPAGEYPNALLQGDFYARMMFGDTAQRIVKTPFSTS